MLENTRGWIQSLQEDLYLKDEFNFLLRYYRESRSHAIPLLQLSTHVFEFEYMIHFHSLVACSRCQAWTANIDEHRRLRPTCRREAKAKAKAKAKVINHKFQGMIPLSFFSSGYHTSLEKIQPICKQCSSGIGGQKWSGKFCPFIVQEKNSLAEGAGEETPEYYKVKYQKASCCRLNGDFETTENLNSLSTFCKVNCLELLKKGKLELNFNLKDNCLALSTRDEKIKDETPGVSKIKIIYRVLHCPTLCDKFENKEKEFSLLMLENVVRYSLSYSHFFSQVKMLWDNYQKNLNNIIYIDTTEHELKPHSLPQHHILLVQTCHLEKKTGEWIHKIDEDGWWFSRFVWKRKNNSRLIYSKEKQVFIFKSIHTFPKLLLQPLPMGMALTLEQAETLNNGKK